MGLDPDFPSLVASCPGVTEKYSEAEGPGALQGGTTAPIATHRQNRAVAIVPHPHRQLSRVAATLRSLDAEFVRNRISRVEGVDHIDVPGAFFGILHRQSCGVVIGVIPQIPIGSLAILADG